MNSTFCDELPRKKHHKELRIAVSSAIDEMEVGSRFSGMKLYSLVVDKHPVCQNCYLETVMRYMRMYRRNKVVCVDRQNSIYERIEGDVDNE